MDCSTFTHEYGEGGRHAHNFPVGRQFEQSEYIGELGEWLKPAVY